MSNSVIALTREELSLAISKVERIHNYKLDSISRYIDENEVQVLSGFSAIREMETIDQKFSQMEAIFSDHPEFESHSPYLVEVAALVS